MCEPSPSSKARAPNGNLRSGRDVPEPWSWMPEAPSLAPYLGGEVMGTGHPRVGTSAYGVQALGGRGRVRRPTLSAPMSSSMDTAVLRMKPVNTRLCTPRVVNPEAARSPRDDLG